jgi:phosphatidylglycerol lysyltransferase
MLSLRVSPFLLICLGLVLGVAGRAKEDLDHTKPATEPLLLARGAFEVAWYQPEQGPVRGLFVLGSGSGGWSYWETRLARHLARRGWAIAGVDFARYASTDYTQDILAGDFARLVAELARRNSPPGDKPQASAPAQTVGPLPVIYGGWSMGAEQALPAAAVVAVRPAGLRGLLLVAPGARGRYGLHTPDKLGITPTGPGTFGLAEFAPDLGGLRLAQLHAGLDPLDSTDWFKGLPLDLRLWKYPRAFHDFSNASDDFLALTDKALRWVLAPPPPAKLKNHE